MEQVEYVGVDETSSLISEEAWRKNDKETSLIPQEYIERVRKYNESDTFPFENLVFNGGGAKCISQVGTLKMFEETGILKNIYRFAGSSGGALTAAFAAVGFSPDEITKILIENNLDKLIKGRQNKFIRYLKIIRNVLTRYGIYDADDFETWLGAKIAEKKDDKGKHFDSSLTFSQLYQRKKILSQDREVKGIELAITASDITRQFTVFYHVKTYPDVPIKTALRMSMSIPLYFTPVRKQPRDDIGWYVDGGVLCNYPIMCYDGWYLSMKKEDNFWQRVSLDTAEDFAESIITRFSCGSECEKECYEKTVGAIVYAANEGSMLTEMLDKRTHEEQKYPDTKLARARRERERDIQKKMSEHKQIHDAMVNIIQIMRETSETSLTLAKMENLLERQDFKRDIDNFFGGKPIARAVDVFHKLKVPTTEKVEFHHFNDYGKEHGLQIIGEFQVIIPPESFRGYPQYGLHIIDTLRSCVARAEFKEYDLKRTIGINTEYLTTHDFDMQEDDKKYLIEQGRIGTMAFLLDFIKKSN